MNNRQFSHLLAWIWISPHTNGHVAVVSGLLVLAGLLITGDTVTSAFRRVSDHLRREK